jgi:DNA mismatch repair protein MutS2
VIPVRTDSRGQVPGVMHGLSSSGQTTFVEPLTIIDQNNELVRLREEEEIEIARILLEITEAFRVNLSGIAAVADALAEIDFTHAKARLSAEFKCVRPYGRTVLLPSKKPSPVTGLFVKAVKASRSNLSEMDEGHQTMVISGPNAGGKTVVVKTVGLIALMAQSKRYVPRSRRTSVLARVSRYGDQQSIAAKPLFHRPYRNIAEMAERVSPPALILLDEGTGPILTKVRRSASRLWTFHRRSTTVATTHYNPQRLASQADGVLNASVEFDDYVATDLSIDRWRAGASVGLRRASNEPSDEIIAQATTLLDPAHSGGDI